jgi:hypothetical protein
MKTYKRTHKRRIRRVRNYRKGGMHNRIFPSHKTRRDEIIGNIGSNIGKTLSNHVSDFTSNYNSRSKIKPKYHESNRTRSIKNMFPHRMFSSRKIHAAPPEPKTPLIGDDSDLDSEVDMGDVKIEF